MMNGLSVKEQLILEKKKAQIAMKLIIKDILRSLIRQWLEMQAQHESQSETPKYVRDLAVFHHSSASNVRLLRSELLNDYQWLHCILKNEHFEMVDITSVVLLFCHSEEITFMMPEDYTMDREQRISLFDDLLFLPKVGVHGLSIHFQWPFPPSSRLKSEFNVISR